MGGRKEEENYQNNKAEKWAIRTRRLAVLSIFVPSVTSLLLVFPPPANPVVRDGSAKRLFGIQECQCWPCVYLNTRRSFAPRRGVWSQPVEVHVHTFLSAQRGEPLADESSGSCSSFCPKYSLLSSQIPFPFPHRLEEPLPRIKYDGCPRHFGVATASECERGKAD